MRFYFAILIACSAIFGALTASAQDASRPKVFKTRSRWGIDALAVDKSGSKLVALDGDSGIRVWDFKSGKVTGNLNSDQLLDIQHVAVDPKGKWLATAERNGRIRLWNLKTGKQEQIIRKNAGDRQAIFSLSFRPDGKQLLYADPDIVLANVRAHAPLVRIDKTIGKSTCARYSPDGKWLAFREGFRPGAIVLWDTATEKIHASVPLEGAGFLKDVLIAPDKKSLFIRWSSFAKKVIHWDLEKRKVIRNYAVDPTAMALSHDGNILALTDREEFRTIRLYNAATGKLLRKLTGNIKVNVASIVFTPDDTKLIAAIGWEICVWDVGKMLANRKK